MIVKFIPPDFWARIVWRASLSLHQFLILDDFGHIQISNFVLSMADKNVCTFHIPMEYFVPMQQHESFEQVVNYLPYL
jgi:hypothetical protein